MMRRERQLVHPDEARDRIRWVIVGPLCLVSFVGFMNGLAPSPFLPHMAESFDTSVALIGQLETASLLFGAAIGLVIGPLADEVGRKRIVLAGLALTALASFGAVLAPNYATLLVVWMLGAGFGGMLTGLNMSIASATFSGDTRRRAIGLIQGAFASAAVFGVPILTTVAAFFSGWRPAFVFAGGAAALSLALIWFVLPDDRPASPGRLSVSNVLRAYAPLIRSRLMIALIIAGAIRGTGWLGLWIYLGAFFIEYHEFSLQRVGLLYLIGGGAYVVGTLAAAGRLGARHLRWQFTVTTLGTCLAWPPIYAGWVSPNVALAMLTVTFFLGAVSFVVHTTLVAQETPAQPSTTLVLNGSVFNIGGAAGAALGGIFLGLGGYSLVGWALPALFVVSALVIWLPRTQRSHGLPAGDPGPQLTR